MLSYYLKIMAQFIAFNQEVEVNRQTVLSVVNSMEARKEARLDILKKNGIDTENNDWFLQQSWLNAFQDIATMLGDMNLFLIGKAIIDNAEFPPINNLEEGLRSIDVAYHMNHRLNGQVMFDPTTGKTTDGIGHYTLKQFDDEQRAATMVCTNPYPSKFDEGIITQVVRRFKPARSTDKVELDLGQGSRTEGGESCTYLITW